MAFREEMLWASLASMLAIWGWYFMGFVGAFRAARFDQAAEAGNFILAVFLIVVVHIVVAAALAILSGRDAQSPADDRERTIALLGYRSAYITLSLIVVTLMITGPILLRIAAEWTPALPRGMAPVLVGNALLAALVLAELANSATQLIRFRMEG